MRHGYKLGRNKHPLPYALTGIVVLLGLVLWMRPAPTATASTAEAAGAVSYAQVQAVMSQRCVACHGEQVQMKNVRVDSAEAVSRNAQAIYQQVVVTKLMPMNNSTGITEEERALVSRWFLAGARVQ
jgi:uncharacterized membrane protein